MIVAGGKRLETLQIAGSDSKAPTIVMLHEGLGSVALWRDFPQAIAARTGCAVMAYSRYGYGRSEPLAEPRPLSYMHDEAQIVLPEVLRACGIERPVLLGHSDGASIALISAGFAPDALRAAIVLAPHVFVEDLSIRSITAAKSTYERTDLRTRLARYHDDPDSAFRGWNDAWLDPAFRSWNIESFLNTITCPVLAIQGAGDEYGTAAQIAAILKAVPTAQAVLIPNCGHSPQRDQPVATLDAIAEFIAHLPSR